MADASSRQLACKPGGRFLSARGPISLPLEQATTPSLEALKAYSLGRKTQYQQGNSASIPLFKRAIELGPNFAVAYTALGISYFKSRGTRLGQ